MNLFYKRKLLQNGRKYQYPSCCIYEFIRTIDVGLNNKSKEQIQASRLKKGFVPCKNHSLLLLKGVITINQLIK